jgi:hypothetical protein
VNCATLSVNLLVSYLFRLAGQEFLKGAIDRLLPELCAITLFENEDENEEFCLAREASPTRPDVDRMFSIEHCDRIESGSIGNQDTLLAH